MTSLGDDISGSGSGMCVGGQCSRNRPGLYAYPPDNNRVRGAATSQTRICGLLLLLPSAILLLQRWWTAAASSQTLTSRGGLNRGTDKKGERLERNFCQKRKKDILGNEWTFSLTKRSKTWQWQYSLFSFARFQCLSLDVIQFVELVSMDCWKKTEMRKAKKKTKRMMAGWWWR